MVENYWSYSLRCTYVSISYIGMVGTGVYGGLTMIKRINLLYRYGSNNSIRVFNHLAVSISYIGMVGNRQVQTKHT